MKTGNLRLVSRGMRSRDWEFWETTQRDFGRETKVLKAFILLPKLGMRYHSLLRREDLFIGVLVPSHPQSPKLSPRKTRNPRTLLHPVSPRGHYGVDEKGASKEGFP